MLSFLPLCEASDFWLYDLDGDTVEILEYNTAKHFVYKLLIIIQSYV